VSVKPTRAERFRPAELIGLSFLLAIFAGVIVAVSTRDVTLGVIFLGVAFIVSLVMFAMLTLVAGDPAAAPGATADEAAAAVEEPPVTGEQSPRIDPTEPPAGPAHS
jgi:hypothetical protein